MTSTGGSPRCSSDRESRERSDDDDPDRARLRASVLVAVAAAANALIGRGASAAARHLIWTLAVAGLLLLLPRALGVRRPAILLPAVAETWDEDRIRAPRAWYAHSPARSRYQRVIRARTQRAWL